MRSGIQPQGGGARGCDDCGGAANWRSQQGVHSQVDRIQCFLVARSSHLEKSSPRVLST
jgi:hypothetical protein